MSVIEDIHQQLNTKNKLFCNCVSHLSTLDPEIKFYRRLRPTQSELGIVDPAAAFEFLRGKRFLYEADRQTTCLVEMDEEPPHDLNTEALDICLTVALMFNSKVVDEIHIMRKIVIDGSNTTGFQRTAIVALGGVINVKSKEITIQTICLEEDAARKIGEEELITTYRIDRLCIPLIEVATAPVIKSPEEAKNVALALGKILRATGKVKRGLGTIRQDLNISIRGGAITEVKGVQDLNLISKVVDYEIQRQLNLLRIRDKLVDRGLTEKDFDDRFIDVTDIFIETICRVIKKAINNGGKVLAVKLPEFADLVKIELEPGVKLGTELADYAKFSGGVGGLFHTEELPAYGVNKEEVAKLRSALNAGSMDVIVFCADKFENVINALKAVVKRSRQLLFEVPSETRSAHLDGTTHYSRPRPGAARMYPETDIPPVPISEERLSMIKHILPEMPEAKLDRLMKQYGLNKKLVSQLINSNHLNLFENISQKTRIAKSFVAATLTETFISLKREGVNIENLSERQVIKTFELIDNGVMAKEAAPAILSWLAEHAKSEVEDAVGILGLKMLSRDQLEEIVNKVIETNIQLIKKRRLLSLKSLMGAVMGEVRGKADVNLVNKLLMMKIKENI